MNEIKVGDWTITEAGMRVLRTSHEAGNWLRTGMQNRAAMCCETLGIDPTADSVARDIAEEIVLHGTPVEEVIAKLQRHLEAGQ
jgi:hypothetical protein